MRNILFSLFAIALASIAAIAATTAMLNAPVRHVPDAMVVNAAPPSDSGASTPAAKPAAPASGKPATPGAAPDAKAASAPAAAAGKDDKDDDADKDPYEGIAPEELPPDLQYNADSSVSFPTNI